ncbi:MAG: glycosyltransferase family 8 protein [Opitutales bacterium]|nr:glycosyltransferase family 8 protein [Opitutales bacterium]
MSDGKTIPIYMCCDDNYAAQLSVVLASVCCNTTANLHFIILNAALSDSSKQNIADSAKSARVDFVSIKPYADAVKDVNVKLKHLSIAACYRYFIPQLDYGYEKGIYLDCDTVVLGDIEKLFDIDLKDAPMAAVEDTVSEKYYKKWGLKNYFNSGVLLLNIKKLREETSAIKLVQKTLELGDSLKYVDQDVLNILYANTSLFLPPKFGAISPLFRKKVSLKSACSKDINEAVYTPVIVHFTGPDKPWKIPCGPTAHPWACAYFYYLGKTKYAGTKEQILRNFNGIKNFVWYFKRHIFFFARPYYLKMRRLYVQNKQKFL